MRILNKLIMAAALATSVLGSSAAFAQANDCNRVAFRFENRWTDRNAPVEIRVQSVTINGSDDSWNENINNQRLEFGEDHTTRQRRLQWHDHGQEASFTVNFEHRLSNRAGWQKATHGPFNMMCNDGDVIRFTIMHN